MLAVYVLVLGLVYRRYLGILGSDRRQPAERQAYDALRDSLAGGNLAACLYAERLTWFLDWIDRFFGDAGMAHRTLFPRAFWLKTRAPLWTAPAFDRCLLLALIYPIVTIFAMWVVSGHVGPADAALQLSPSTQGWRRALEGVLFVVTTAAALRSQRTTGWKSLAWFLFAVTGAFYFAVARASTTAITRGWQGPFLSFFVALMIAACLMAARLLSHLLSWQVAGPVLLLLGLLTLLNAPF
jgi:hypothetical protein